MCVCVCVCECEYVRIFVYVFVYESLARISVFFYVFASESTWYMCVFWLVKTKIARDYSKKGLKDRKPFVCANFLFQLHCFKYQSKSWAVCTSMTG